MNSIVSTPQNYNLTVGFGSLKVNSKRIMPTFMRESLDSIGVTVKKIPESLLEKGEEYYDTVLITKTEKELLDNKEPIDKLSISTKETIDQENDELLSYLELGNIRSKRLSPEKDKNLLN